MKNAFFNNFNHSDTTFSAVKTDSERLTTIRSIEVVQINCKDIFII